MKTIGMILLLAVFSFTMYAENPAPLGKVLSRIYPTISDNEQTVVLVYLKDKGTHLRSVMDAPTLLSKESIARRLRVRTQDKVIDESDYPLERSYIQTFAGQ